MTTILAAMSGVVQEILSAATTGAGDPIATPPSFIHHNFIIRTAAGVTGGAIQIETSNQADYAGTWAPLSIAGTTNPITVVAGAEVLGEYEGRLNFVRARVSTTIAGGTIAAATVEYQGGKNY